MRGLDEILILRKYRIEATRPRHASHRNTWHCPYAVQHRLHLPRQNGPKWLITMFLNVLNISTRLLETRVARWEHLWGCPVWPSHMHGLCTAVLALFYMKLDRLVLP